MDESKRKVRDVDELRRLLDRSISPFEIHVTKSVSSSPLASQLDRGDSREQMSGSRTPCKGSKTPSRNADATFRTEIEEICKIYDVPKKARNSPQVFPFDNDDSGQGNSKDFHVSFHVDAFPTKPESKRRKCSQKSAYSNENQECKKKRKTKSDMVISGKSCVVTSESSEANDYQKYFKVTKKKNEAIDEELQRYSNHDIDIEKLNRELKDANNILQNIELDIKYLREEKQVSQIALAEIKSNYRSLLEEKFQCQKQMSHIRKELCANRITDKRMIREFEQLKLFYEKLDHKERTTRKAISLLEAELSLVVNKLHIPSCKRPLVPKLDLSKLMQPKRKLPPVKNTPSAPRKICEVIQVFESNQSKKMKRYDWPLHSLSSPILQQKLHRSIPNNHEVTNFLPLIGNQKPLSLRPEKSSASFQCQNDLDNVLPTIEEQSQNSCRSSERNTLQGRQDCSQRFLPKLQGRVPTV